MSQNSNYFHPGQDSIELNDLAHATGGATLPADYATGTYSLGAAVPDFSMGADDVDGIVLRMPADALQTANGPGDINLFDLAQVNSLVSNGHLGSAVVSFEASGSNGVSASSGSNSQEPSGNFPNSIFTQEATANGGAASNGETNSDHAATSPVPGSAAGGAPITQEAFTQSITMGGNIQYNALTLDLSSHDTLLSGHHS